LFRSLRSPLSLSNVAMLPNDHFFVLSRLHQRKRFVVVLFKSMTLGYKIEEDG
jgi:hypothetical protein